MRRALAVLGVAVMLAAGLSVAPTETDTDD
jgi:hypothetical protein